MVRLACCQSNHSASRQPQKQKGPGNPRVLLVQSRSRVSCRSPRTGVVGDCPLRSDATCHRRRTCRESNAPEPSVADTVPDKQWVRQAPRVACPAAAVAIAASYEAVAVVAAACAVASAGFPHTARCRRSRDRRTQTGRIRRCRSSRRRSCS